MERKPLWDRPNPDTWTPLERGLFNAITRFGPKITFTQRLIVADRAVEAAEQAIESLDSSPNPVVQ